MDPPGKNASLNGQQPPLPFEIALVRKIKSKTTSVRDAFLLLDIDRDGRISPTDVRTVLHNELGLDITKEQEALLLSRVPQWKKGENQNTSIGMGYTDFAKYYQDVSSATFPSSEAGLAAAVGFHRDDTDGNARANSEMSIHLQPQTILHQRRHQLQQLLMTHSSRVGSGMMETSLFLAIDVHRSGKVTMQEFLDWINSLGMQWTMEEMKQVILGDKDNENEGIGMEREKLESRWFGTADVDNGRREAGMTEHEFAEFVESLDSE
mmetsp:Transcript_25317/g.54476  ORF Transcript_25317/g.54476 Transcript_25317/m.54476 type:complete len:265 (+) Transcript_25317:53-847(+)